MSDKWLPRLVAFSLVVLTALTVLCGAFLAVRGIDDNQYVVLAGTFGGALAGFFAGSKFGSD